MKGGQGIHPRWWLWLGLALTAYKLWLTRGQGLVAYPYALHDDHLFVLLSQHLINGEWLGPYHELTLAKGPAYPFFIATAFLFGVPLFLAQHLLYAGAAAVFCRSLRPAIPAAGWRFAIYALLLWNPMTYDAPAMGRVLRQHLYGPLALLIIASLVGLYLRRDARSRQLLPWAVLLGAAGGMFYLTREESFWLLPSVTLLAGAYLIGAWRSSRQTARRAGGVLLIAAAVSILPILLVCIQNHRHYGWFGTTELRAPAFQAAYGAMLRVEAGPRLPFVPVTREAREQMAQVSPAFARVQQEFARGLARDWAEASAFLTGQDPAAEQIGGGWLLWAFRHAAAQAGQHTDAAQALAFYRQLAQEVNEAGDRGLLPAGPPRHSYLPPWPPELSGAWLSTARQLLEFVVHFRSFSAVPPPSTGSAEGLTLFRDLTRERLSPPGGEHDVVGAERYMLNLGKVERLQAIGKALRTPLRLLGWLAGGYLALRLLHVTLTRRWSYPLTLALAAGGAVLASVLLHAAIQVSSFPVNTISSFAPVYPLLLVTLVAVAWDAAQVVSTWRHPLTATPTWLTVFPHPSPGRWSHVHRYWPAWIALVSLTPLFLWWGEFRHLYWFGDDLFLIDQIANMGLGEWSLHVFSENFVPLFKILWGGALLAFDGNYFAMILLLWLTHALNTTLLGLLMRRAGFPVAATALTLVLFALTPANLETLGWSVQWSAVLATTFLLLGLLAVEWYHTHPTPPPAWRLYAGLALCAGASACSFSRGVLTGPILAAAVLLPAFTAAPRVQLLSRLAGATACLLPSLLVAGIIAHFSSGNHQHLGVNAGAAFDFGLSYWLFNPGHLLLGGTSLHPAVLIGLALGKLTLVLSALALSRDRVRLLLLVLLAFDLGSAVLVGIGRHHTGFLASLSSRYQYYALIATLPSLGLLFAWALRRLLPHPLGHRLTAATLLTAMAIICLTTWPGTLRPFADWRGQGMREIMAAPTTTDPSVTVPALDFMHVERAKALQRAFNLH